MASPFTLQKQIGAEIRDRSLRSYGQELIGLDKSALHPILMLPNPAVYGAVRRLRYGKTRLAYPKRIDQLKASIVLDKSFPVRDLNCQDRGRHLDYVEQAMDLSAILAKPERFIA